MGFSNLNVVIQIPFPNLIFTWNQSNISQYQINIKIGKIVFRTINSTSFWLFFSEKSAVALGEIAQGEHAP